MMCNYIHSDTYLIKKKRDGFFDVPGTGFSLPSWFGWCFFKKHLDW